MMTRWTRYSAVVAIALSGLGGFACAPSDQPSSSSASSSSPASASTPPRVAADKPFAPGGSITLRLEAGSYEVRPAADAHIRVTLSGNVGDAKADVTMGEG